MKTVTAVVLAAFALVGCDSKKSDAPAFEAPQSPADWALSVQSKDKQAMLSKVTPFVFQHGPDTCYVFIQDFGGLGGALQDYRANIAVSCVRGK